MSIFSFRRRSYFYADLEAANERIVEVPIFHDLISGFKSSQILEVGNVLHQYFGTKHTVLDLYEDSPNITIHKNAIGWLSGRRYDLIISISTLEHFGERIGPQGCYAPACGLYSLCRNLNPMGEFWFSIPCSQNFFMDRTIRDGEFVADEWFGMRRVEDRIWEQCSKEDAMKMKYDEPFACANGILIGVIYG
jgi:hypothetical protein